MIVEPVKTDGDLPGAGPALASREGRGALKIAFIKRGSFSHANARIGEQLRRVFPEYEVEEIDVFADYLRENRPVILANIAWMLWLYGRDMLARRHPARLCFYRTPYIFRKIRTLLRKHLVPRAHEFAFSLQTQSLYDASLPGVPNYVYTDHTHLANLYYPAFTRDRLFRRTWIELEREIYTQAAHVFVMGSHVQRSLRDHYGVPADRVSCIHAGSNIEEQSRALENDGYSNRTIVFVGVDWERKGGPTLLDAFERVLDRMPEARLVIVGCSPSIRHARVEVVGRVSREEVRRRLVQGAVFCLPTRVEPLGIAIIEALSLGVPVVASAIGAIPDIVQEGVSGRLVPPDDPAALASALLELLGDPEMCRRMGEAGKSSVAARFNWAAVGDRLREGIQEQRAGVQERR